MKYTYNAIIENKDNKYYARINELPGCITTGKTYEDAINQITDAASIYLIVTEDENHEIPKSNIQILSDAEEKGVSAIISVDTDAYRKSSL